MVKSFRESDICKNFAHKDKAKIFSYIEALYSEKSPLNQIDNLDERKLEACQVAKLNPEDEDVKAIMAIKHKEVLELIFYYIEVCQNNNTYYSLITRQQLYSNIQREIMTCTDIDKSIKLSKESDTIRDLVKKDYSELYEKVGGKELVEKAQKMVRVVRLEDRLKKKNV
jgi:hypothetical protein